jgi:hypothetical protein
MKKIAAAERPQGRAELSCIYCGHGLGEVPVPRGRRPTGAELRAAYAAAPDAVSPTWDAHGSPRCPRCRALLFVELSDHQLRTHVEARRHPRSATAERSEEREDAYAREDVYVGGQELGG